MRKGRQPRLVGRCAGRGVEVCDTARRIQKNVDARQAFPHAQAVPVTGTQCRLCRCGPSVSQLWRSGKPLPMRVSSTLVCATKNPEVEHPHSVLRHLRGMRVQSFRESLNGPPAQRSSFVHAARFVSILMVARLKAGAPIAAPRTPSYGANVLCMRD